ncbi:vanadium-dependent haloperoxidase [Falsiroseomonas sp. HC035]|uniref:vanadium-dependent haloperoxidase n=1 Tax=Falsiroseomonas sp. HC035 TaxID=3390999 RepID=UPI003D315C2C
MKEFGALERRSRTAEQSVIGVYWGYDGAQGLGVPPRLYNQIARKIALARNLTLMQTAVMFAEINVAMADAGIDAWHYKYQQNLWRPVAGIRDEVQGYADPFRAPYGAPQTNRPGGAPTTPPFPAYPSGHAAFGAAMFQVLRLRLGGPALTVATILDAADGGPVEEEAFSFVSDELDGRAVDADGSVRTRVERPFNSYARAVWENAISRVYLGVHWRFDGLPRNAADDIGGVPLGLTIGRTVHELFNDGASLGGP